MQDPEEAQNASAYAEVRLITGFIHDQLRSLASVVGLSESECLARFGPLFDACNKADRLASALPQDGQRDMAIDAVRAASDSLSSHYEDLVVARDAHSGPKLTDSENGSPLLSEVPSPVGLFSVTDEAAGLPRDWQLRTDPGDTLFEELSATVKLHVARAAIAMPRRPRVRLARKREPQSSHGIIDAICTGHDPAETISIRVEYIRFEGVVVRVEARTNMGINGDRTVYPRSAGSAPLSTDAWDFTDVKQDFTQSSSTTTDHDGNTSFTSGSSRSGSVERSYVSPQPISVDEMLAHWSRTYPEAAGCLARLAAVVRIAVDHTLHGL